MHRHFSADEASHHYITRYHALPLQCYTCDRLLVWAWSIHMEHSRCIHGSYAVTLSIHGDTQSMHGAHMVHTWSTHRQRDISCHGVVFKVMMHRMRVCQHWEEGQVTHCSPTSKVIHEGMHSVNLETSQQDLCQPEACTHNCASPLFCR